MGLQVHLFDDLGLQTLPESNGCMCLNHSKYECFGKVPPFLLICYFGVLREALGPHFERFWGTLGSFLWFWRVLEMGWNFDVFWDLTWGTPGCGNMVR